MNDWIEWDGSEYKELARGDEHLFTPVPVGTRVDIRLRDGKEFYNLPAGERTRGSPVDASGPFWKHEGMKGDIVAYRLAGA